MPDLRDRAALFLDMDGVIVDNGPALSAAFRRAVSEVLHERLGGSLEAWAQAHDVAFRTAPRTPAGLTPEEAFRHENILGVRWPCRLLRIAAPEDDEVCLEWGREMNRRARLEYATFFPGMPGAIEALGARYALHTSSGNERWIIEGMLHRIAVRERFGVTCGADLAGARKGTPEFYPRVFALAGVEPREAVIVDDQAEVVRLGAAQTGAAGVLVSAGAAPTVEGIDLVVPSLAALAALLAR